MRIAVACHTALARGGVESYVSTIVPALMARGHQVSMLYESADPEPAPRPGVEEVWHAGARPAPALEGLRGWKPDVIFLQGYAEHPVEAALPGIAPTVLFAHSYYGTCISGSKMHAAPAAARCTRAFGAACLALYYPRRCGGLGPVTALRMYGRQRARRRLLPSFAAVIVASRHMQREYQRHGLDACTHVVPLPAPHAGEPPCAPTSGLPLRLAYAGRLEWTKGADLALDAAARAARILARPLTMSMAGRGPLEASLRRRAAVLRREIPSFDVVFPGWLPADGIGKLLRSCDLVVVPSRWPEPFGLIGLEAAAHGVPAVAFDAGGIPEWLEDGHNGRLVKGGPLTADRLADAVAECLRDEPGLARMRMGALAVSRRFSLAQHVQRVEGVLMAATRHPVLVS